MSQFSRRQFIGASVAGLAISTLAHSPSEGFSDVEKPKVSPTKSDEISMGLLEVSDLDAIHLAMTEPEVEHEIPWSVVSKTDIPLAPFKSQLVHAYGRGSGDPEFLNRGAKVTIYGPEPFEQHWIDEGIERFAIWGRTVPEKQNKQVPAIMLWSFEHDQDRVASSAPITFTAQIGQAGLELFSEHALDGPTWHSLRFTLESDPDWPALRRGAYVIGLAGGDRGRLPHWPDYALRASDPADSGGRKYLYQPQGKGLQMATFPYLVVVVEYAN